MPVANPSYYLDDYADEVLPEGLERTSLEGWAKWLAMGGGTPSFDPPADGKVYSGSALHFLGDVTATKDGDGEVRLAPMPPEGWDFAAIRLGPGLGWYPDDILAADNLDDLATKLADKLETGDEELVAFARSENDLRLTYRADPPRLEVEKVQ